MSNLYLEPMIHEHTPAKPRVFIIDLRAAWRCFS